MKTRPIPTLNVTSEEPKYVCKECGRGFEKEFGLTMHEIRAHGYQNQKTPSSSASRTYTRLSFEQRMKIVNYLKARKPQIEEKRLTKEEIVKEVSEVFGLEGISFSHLSQPAKIVGIQWPSWSKMIQKEVVVKVDTQTLLNFALILQEIYAKLSDLLGETPKLLTQMKESLQAELRKEQEAAKQLEKIKSDGTE